MWKKKKILFIGWTLWNSYALAFPILSSRRTENSSILSVPLHVSGKLNLSLYGNPRFHTSSSSSSSGCHINSIEKKSAEDDGNAAAMSVIPATTTTTTRRRIGLSFFRRMRWEGLWRRLRCKFPRAMVTLAFSLLCLFGNISTAAAVSGGRMGGGSFKSSSSSPSSSSGRGTTTLSRPVAPRYTPSPYYSSGRPLLPIPIPIRLYSVHHEWYAPTRATAITNTRMSTRDIAIVTGTGLLLAYGFSRSTSNNRAKEGDGGGPLGPGYTVGSVTVALNVPDRSVPANILKQLSLWSLSADTVTRKGLQDLLSSVTLELLRQEQTITAAYAQSSPYPVAGQAEREFQRLSVNSQSKVDRLTVNRFGTKRLIDTASSAASEKEEAPTVAVVTINFCMSGDSTALPVIRSREDLRQALSLIASDALVGECLITAEVLWSPSDATETLSREELLATYPDLVPI